MDRETDKSFYINMLCAQYVFALYQFIRSPGHIMKTLMNIAKSKRLRVGVLEGINGEGYEKFNWKKKNV